VPDYYSANLQLVMWVSNQRRNYWFCQEGKPNPMTAERFFNNKTIHRVLAVFKEFRGTPPGLKGGRGSGLIDW